MHKYKYKSLVLMFLFLIPELVFTWGSTGHKIINRRAVRNLPESMSIFKADSLFYEAHASDADYRRDYSDTNLYAEQWRHYLDIDDYPNFQNLPKDLNILINLYGLNRVKNNGTNPWAVIWFLDSLTNQLARNDFEKVKQTASDLGHYIGDGFQPLHCTVNYNGQLTGNDGIHSRYETTMLNTFQSQIITQITDIAYINSPIDYVFDYILYSNSLVDSILQADNYAKIVSGWNGVGTAPSSYYNALWDKAKDFTISAFQKAITTLASFWYTAYMNSGKMQISTVPAQINFGEIPVGNSIIDSVMITNITAETLILNVVNPDTQNFQIFPRQATIPKGHTCKFYVFFHPSTAGTFLEYILFDHNLNIPPIYLRVNGNSYQQAFSIDRNTIYFSDLFVGENQIDSIYIYNLSGTNLNINLINPDTLNFSVSPKNLNIPTDSSAKFYVVFHPKIPRTFDLQFLIEHNLGTAQTPLNVIGNATIYSISLNINSDWNLISVPIVPFDSAVSILFSNSIVDYFYTYSEVGYRKQYFVKNGVGYWAKFTQAQTMSIQGIPLYIDTIQVNKGWNIIGTISKDINITNLITEPQDLVLSNFYGYNGNYFITDTLKSGAGYWVKADREGKIILSRHANDRVVINIDPTSINPPPPPGMHAEFKQNYNLYQNFPNPFNPTTKIDYYLAKNAYVQLIIFDVLGKEIVKLVDESQRSGSKSVTFDGSNYPSGIYFYKLVVTGEDSYTTVKKMSLIK